MAVTIDVTGQEEGDYELKIGVTGPDGSNATTIRRVQLAVASPGAPQ